jgi:hypothetical protein
MIKSFLSFGIAAVLSFSAIAQSTAVTTAIPAPVSTAFQVKYPNVSNVTWNQEAGYFQPIFADNGVQTVGYIDMKGNFIQTIAKVGAAGLPATATAYITQNYHGATVSEAGRIDFTSNIPSRFYAKVGTTQLLFDAKGNFLKTTASPLKQ